MRQRVLEAAVGVVRQVGVADATTRRIASAAGVSEGSIFNYFPTKAALLKAVFTEGIDNPLPAAMQRLWSQVGSGDLKGNLASLVPAAVKFYSEVLPLSGPPFIGSRAIRRTREQVDEEQFGPIIGHQTLVRYLTVEQPLGAFHAETDIPLLATAFFGACQQYAFLSLTATPAQLEVDESGLTTDVLAFARRLLDALLPRQ
jgi:AcrR family transcriptional regulator